jgi:hypothetical protein
MKPNLRTLHGFRAPECQVLRDWRRSASALGAAASCQVFFRALPSLHGRNAIASVGCRARANAGSRCRISGSLSERRVLPTQPRWSGARRGRGTRGPGRPSRQRRHLEPPVRSRELPAPPRQALALGTPRPQPAGTDDRADSPKQTGRRLPYQPTPMATTVHNATNASP